MMDIKDNIKDIANAPTEMLELLRRIADACEAIAEQTAQTKTNTDETALRCEEISGQTQGILNTQTQVLKQLQSLPGIPVQAQEHVS